MQQTIEDFFKAVRAADIEISVADAIEASNTIKLVGFHSRSLLKDALSVTLAKTADEEETLEECFDQFFSFEAFQQGGDDLTTADELLEQQDDGEQDAPAGGDTQEYDGESKLAKMLLNNEKAELAKGMKEAARELNMTDIWFFTQKGIYTQKIMKQMGVEKLNQEIARLGKGDCPSSIAQANSLRQGRKRLFYEIQNFVEQQLTLYGKTASEKMHQQYLQQMKLSNIEHRDFNNMAIIVQKMAKRLSTMHSKKKKQKQRGQLDFRKTLRKNVAYDGVMFETFWKTKVVNKPRIITICDVSGSVKSYSRFLLLFLYGLSEVLSRIDSYAFTNSLIDISDVFDDYPVEQAVEVAMERVGQGSTDYGQTFLEFKMECMDKLDNKTTVLILGDARNNDGDAQIPVMKDIYKRAKRVIWLNPEPRTFWGTGDSEMLNYLPYCHVAKECNTIKHLERMVDNLLKSTQQSA